MTNKIVFNGTTYDSVEEMPADVRQAYEQIMGAFADKNQNGMPDIFENMAKIDTQNTNIKRNFRIVIDGQQYDSVDQLPPETRQKYEQAMGKLDANQNGIPDFAEGVLGTTSVSSMTSNLTSSQPPFPTSSAIPTNTTSAIEPENNNLRWVMIGAGLIVLLCLGAIGVWILIGR